MIGVSLKASTLSDWLKNEATIPKSALQLPKGAKNIVNVNNNKVERVVLEWLEQQRKKCVPVSGKMIRKAAETIFFVLQDCFEFDDQDNGTVPSFSASWFNSFKRRHQVSYCQLHGEAGSVDLDANEPELVKIRELCSQYSPEDIYNCDETGLYLKELNSKSYTVDGNNSGGKPHRECRVSLLMCVNASELSITLSKDKDALCPLLIAKNYAKDVDPEALKLMTIKTTKSGWMTGSIFMEWLQLLDSQLERPSVLLLDSCPAHNNIEDIHLTNLRIQRPLSERNGRSCD